MGPGARHALAEDESLSEQEKAMFIQAEEIPVRVLEILSDSETPEVRHLVAINPRVSVNILSKLASDENVNVRRAVASSRYISERLLKRMIRDPSKYVSRAALKNPNLSSNTIRLLYQAGDETEYLARNPSVPEDILQEIVASGDIFLLSAVASNQSLKSELADELFRFNNRLVNIQLCGNRSVPRILIEKYSSPDLLSGDECAKRLVSTQ